MTRKSALFAAILIAALAIFALIRPMAGTYAVLVRLPAINAVEYVSDNTRTREWMVPFRNAASQNQTLYQGHDSLKVLKHSGLSLTYERTQADNRFNFSISVIPHKDSAALSYYVLNCAAPRWRSLTTDRSLIREARQSLDSLKAFVSNPAKLYGFPIKPAMVEDTAFLFASRIVSADSFATASKAIFDMLIGQAAKKNAGYTGVRIFHFQNEGNGRRTIFAGVGVSKRIDSKLGDEAIYKLMPYQKNLLVIDYTGPYAGVQKAYDALHQFQVDNGYMTMAIPFHKYLDQGYGYSDSQFVRTRVCLPVF